MGCQSANRRPMVNDGERAVIEDLKPRLADWNPLLISNAKATYLVPALTTCSFTGRNLGSPMAPMARLSSCPLISAPPCDESLAIGWESIGTTCGKNSHVSPQSLGDIHPKSDIWALGFLCFHHHHHHHHHHHQLSEWSSKPSKVSSGVAPDALPSGRALPLVAHRGVYCLLGLQLSMISTQGNDEMIWNAGSCSKMVGMQGSNAGNTMANTSMCSRPSKQSVKSGSFSDFWRDRGGGRASIAVHCTGHPF